MDISVYGRYGVGACQVNKAINMEYIYKFIELDDDNSVNDLMKMVNELRLENCARPRTMLMTGLDNAK